MAGGYADLFGFNDQLQLWWSYGISYSLRVRALTSFEISSAMEDRIHIPREWNNQAITFRDYFVRTKNSDHGAIPPMVVVYQVDNQLLPTTPWL